MAATNTTIQLTWENGNYFELRCKETDESPILTILHVDENSNIEGLWNNIAGICVDFFAQRIKRVKDDMMS